MSSIGSIALSGMHAAQDVLSTAASNVANALTDGYQRREVKQSEEAGGGVSTKQVVAAVGAGLVAADLVSQMQARNTFLASLAVFKTLDSMAGALLDQKA